MGETNNAARLHKNTNRRAGDGTQCFQTARLLHSCCTDQDRRETRWGRWMVGWIEKQREGREGEEDRRGGKDASRRDSRLKRRRTPKQVPRRVEFRDARQSQDSRPNPARDVQKQTRLSLVHRYLDTLHNGYPTGLDRLGWAGHFAPFHRIVSSRVVSYVRRSMYCVCRYVPN